MAMTVLCDFDNKKKTARTGEKCKIQIKFAIWTNKKSNKNEDFDKIEKFFANYALKIKNKKNNQMHNYHTYL